MGIIAWNANEIQKTAHLWFRPALPRLARCREVQVCV